MAYDFVIGVDVGKYFHHACVLDPQECPIVCVRGLGLQVVRESVGVSHG